MLRTETIGILGAGGAVGVALRKHLGRLGFGHLRIGTRKRPERLQASEQWMHADADDPQSLRDFCADCQVVVNCAGPSSHIGDRVARAALTARALYVDPGGDEPLYEKLREIPKSPAAACAVLSAGLMPGLTSLIPRWLARQSFDEVRGLTAYVGLRDFFTPAAATDYLSSLINGYGEPLAAWRAGARASRALQPVVGAEIPFFAKPVNAYPYLSQEARRLAEGLRLEELSWYTIVDGEHVWPILARVQQEHREGNLVALADELSRAAKVDLFGSSASQTLVFCMEGQQSDAPMRRTLLLRSSSTYEVTAAFTAVTIAAYASPCSLRGVHYAAEVMDPLSTIEALRALECWNCFELIDGSILDEAEQGAC